jgi:HSP90 family molecular chaperone
VAADVQGSLFEEDYLLRTLGILAQSPDAALTELVANAWDAGASLVEIVIPDDHDQIISVKDDGSGMTPEQFRQRWMTLGYDRVKHQGSSADFPSDRADWSRRAFGRNGVGRHGLLCFADEYRVETLRDGRGGEFQVRTSAGQEPFVLAKQRLFKAKGHGTTLTTTVVRNLPDAYRCSLSIQQRPRGQRSIKVSHSGSAVGSSECLPGFSA